MSAALGSVPALGISRPALDLLSQFAKGPREVTLATAMEVAEKPRSTVSRWLGELVDACLLLRLTRDAYAVPSRPTQALLLLEPSAYARSLLLHHDVLARSKVPYAFACIPVRKAMPFSLERAAPVLNLRDKRVQEFPASAFPDAFRATFTKQEETTETLRFPTDAYAGTGSSLLVSRPKAPPHVSCGGSASPPSCGAAASDFPNPAVASSRQGDDPAAVRFVRPVPSMS